MVYKETYLNVIDNTGALVAGCIHVYNKQFAQSGDLILVSVKKAKPGKRVKKGEIYKAIVLRTKCFDFSYTGWKRKYTDNSIVLLRRENLTPVGTRIKGFISGKVREKGHLKLLLLSYGCY